MINTSEDRTEEVLKDSLLSNQNRESGVEGIEAKKGKENRFDGLGEMDIWAYGIGHLLNDMTSTCWFNYLLFFLTEVVKTSAGPFTLLAGQLADGIATPIVGALSDKTKSRIGQRRPWYILGFTLVILGFLPLFQDFSIFSDNKTMQAIYYIGFASIFNIGWACLQISHMSLVPSLSCSRKRRDKLNNLRNTFTFISGLLVLCLGLIVFSTMSNRTFQMNIISYVVVAIGAITSIIFMCKIKQVKLTQICIEKSLQLKQQLTQPSNDKTSAGTANETEYSQDFNMKIHASIKKNVRVDKWYDWFKMPSFYVFGICYMGVRSYCNLFGTLLPFYLVYVLDMGSEQADKIPFTMALVQLLVYFASVSTSFFLTRLYLKFGRRNIMLAGGVLCMASAVSMIFLKKATPWPIYLIAIIVGIAQSTTLSTGINLISQVVGTKSKKGAIVFGIYSLLDKFATGIIIFVISNSSSFQSKNSQFIKLMTVIVPSSVCLLSCILVYFNPVKQYGKKARSPIKKRKSSLEDQLVI